MKATASPGDGSGRGRADLGRGGGDLKRDERRGEQKDDQQKKGGNPFIQEG